MPRVKPLGKDPRETEMLAELGATLTVMGISRKQLAELTGINYATLKNRFRNVRGLRLGELWKIRDARKRAGVELGEQ